MVRTEAVAPAADVAHSKMSRKAVTPAPGNQEEHELRLSNPVYRALAGLSVTS